MIETTKYFSENNLSKILSSKQKWLLYVLNNQCKLENVICKKYTL